MASRSLGEPMPWTLSGSMRVSCTIMRGFSAVAGSWKTTETERPRVLRSAAVRPRARPLK